MRSSIVGFILVLLVTAGIILYDANKYFTSSWAVRAYYFFYEGHLNRIAEALEEEPDVQVVGIAVNGRVVASPTDGVTFDGETQARLDAKYEPLLGALYPNPFLLACNAWFKAKTLDGLFCIGWRTRYLTVWRDPEGPRFHLFYWPNGVSEVQPCRKSRADDRRAGVCDMPLAERWTIHYEWLPSFRGS